MPKSISKQKRSQSEFKTKSYKLIWKKQTDGRWFAETDAPKTFQFFGLISTFEWDLVFPHVKQDAEREYLHCRLDEICYGYYFADPRKGGIVHQAEILMRELYITHPGARIYLDFDRANFPILVVSP